MAGYFELSNAAGCQFKFNLKAANHQVILSSELYTTKSAAQGGIASVQKNAVSDTRYERRTGKGLLLHLQVGLDIAERRVCALMGVGGPAESQCEPERSLVHRKEEARDGAAQCDTRAAGDSTTRIRERYVST